MPAEQIVSTVIAATCALIGAAILSLGLRQKSGWLKTLGTAFLLGGTVSLFVQDANFRGILTAAAGVIAAIAAAFALQQNTQLRRDAKERELRDRYDRLLNEVIDWAKNVLTSGLGPGLRTEFDPTPEGIELLKDSMLQHVTELQRINRDGMYLGHIILPTWQNLAKKVKHTRKEIGVHLKLLHAYVDNPTDSDAYGSAQKQRGKLNDAAEGTIKEAASIRIKYLELK